MTCIRCRGLLMTEQAETTDGRLVMIRCIVCGYRDDPLMREHKRLRPESHRQIPHKPAKRPNRSIGQRADRRS